MRGVKETWKSKKRGKARSFVFGMSHGEPSGLEPKIEK
jgi:hypothetical protein